VSSRYLAQIYYDHEGNVDAAIMPTLLSATNDNSVEFTLLVLAKVLRSPKLQLGFDFEDIRTIIGRVRSLELMNPHNDGLLCLYPGLVRVFVMIKEASGKGKSDLQLREMMGELFDE
jgi:hypothetical protein